MQDPPEIGPWVAGMDSMIEQPPTPKPDFPRPIDPIDSPPPDIKPVPPPDIPVPMPEPPIPERGDGSPVL